MPRFEDNDGQVCNVLVESRRKSISMKVLDDNVEILEVDDVADNAGSPCSFEGRSTDVDVVSIDRSFSFRLC